MNGGCRVNVLRFLPFFLPQHRFDAYGQGLGKNGRVDRDKVSDLSQLTDRTHCDVRGRKVE